MTDDEVQLKVRVPDELKDLVDADRRNNKEVVKVALWSEYGGRKKSALQAKKQHKIEQLQAIEKEIEKERDDKDRVRSEVDALEAKIRRMEENEVVVQEFVDALLDDVEDGDINHLVPEIIASREHFDRLDESAEDVHELAKTRALEQQRSLRESHFMSYKEAQATDGMTRRIADAWGDGDE